MRVLRSWMWVGVCAALVACAPEDDKKNDDNVTDSDLLGDEDPTDEENPSDADPTDEEVPTDSDPTDEEVPGDSDPTDEDAPGDSDPTDEDAPGDNDPTDEDAPGDSDPTDEDGGNEAPATPVITSPSANDVVYDEVTITGTGAPNTDYEVQILVGTTTLNGGIGSTDESGDFSHQLHFTQQEPGTTLTVSVTLSNAFGTSQAATVNVVQGGPATLYAVTSPTFEATVASSFYVSGTATPLADIDVDVTDGAESVFSASGSVAANGRFDIPVVFSGVAPGTWLTVTIDVSNDFGSDTFGVDVQFNPSTLSGTVTYAGERTGRLIVHAHDTTTLYPVAELIFETWEPTQPYELQVPADPSTSCARSLTRTATAGHSTSRTTMKPNRVDRSSTLLRKAPPAWI